MLTCYSFITRNKSDRVGVDAYQISGENNDLFLCDHNLNISQRMTLEELD